MKRLEFIAVALFVLGLSACKASTGELCQQDEDCQSGRCCGGLVADADGRGRCAAADPSIMCMPLQTVTPRPDAGPPPDAGPLPDGGPVDAGVDAGTDAGQDAGSDAGPMSDAGTDAGMVDAGVDAGGADAGRDAGGSDAGV